MSDLWVTSLSEDVSLPSSRQA